ncbi:hypothetical protein ACO1G0_03095 [Fusobacterium watanabei]|uniref:hypothetical protein n=1 Tax=Fusobacterium watanabei TaxID=2686067 RepID=UPI003B585FD6
MGIIKGAFLDTALLAIANYLIKKEEQLEEIGSTLNFSRYIDWILSKYKLVEEHEKENFKNSVKKLYEYKKGLEIKSINSLQFAKFMVFKNTEDNNSLEKELDEKLTTLINLS